MQQLFLKEYKLATSMLLIQNKVSRKKTGKKYSNMHTSYQSVTGDCDFAKNVYPFFSFFKEHILLLKLRDFTF